MMNKHVLVFLGLGLALLGFAIGKWTGGHGGASLGYGGQDPVRKVSSVGMEENELIEEINEFIIGIRDKSEVRPALKRLEDLATKNPEMKIVNLYHNVARHLSYLEGIVWRMRPLIESCGACHLAALNFIKGLYYRNYMMGPHVNAIMDYLVEPNIHEPQFEGMADFQDFLMRRMIPVMSIAIKKIDQIAGSLPEDFVFEFDNYLITGYDKDKNIRFISDTRRHKKVVRGNLYYLLAQKSRITSFMLFAINYNFDNLMDYYQRVVKATTLNNMFGRLPKNNTPKEYLELLAEREFRSLGTTRLNVFRPKDIQRNLDEAFKYFYSSLDYRVRGLEESYRQSNLEDSADYLIRPRLLSVNYDDVLSNMKERRDIFKNAMDNGQATLVTSRATGMQFRVNPSVFFKYHPDLKAFLPEGKFAQNVRGGCLKHNGNCVKHALTGEDIHKWNFDYGKPVSWKDPTFGGLFPDATNQNFYEILRSARMTPSTRRIGLVLPLL